MWSSSFALLGRWVLGESSALSDPQAGLGKMGRNLKKPNFTHPPRVLLGFILGFFKNGFFQDRPAVTPIETQYLYSIFGYSRTRLIAYRIIA